MLLAISWNDVLELAFYLCYLVLECFLWTEHRICPSIWFYFLFGLGFLLRFSAVAIGFYLSLFLCFFMRITKKESKRKRAGRVIRTWAALGIRLFYSFFGHATIPVFAAHNPIVCRGTGIKKYSVFEGRKRCGSFLSRGSCRDEYNKSHFFSFNGRKTNR